jgi:hypothetical protein
MSLKQVALILLLLPGACEKKPAVRLKVLIGATTIVSPGAQPIADSMIVIAGSKIQSVGKRTDVPVPPASDRTDLTGSWIVPAKGSRIAVNETANLVILHHAPTGNDVPAPGETTTSIVAGEWKITH